MARAVADQRAEQSEYPSLRVSNLERNQSATAEPSGSSTSSATPARGAKTAPAPAVDDVSAAPLAHSHVEIVCEPSASPSAPMSQRVSGVEAHKEMAHEAIDKMSPEQVESLLALLKQRGSPR